MTIRSLQTLTSLFTRDDERLDASEAQRLVDASRDGRVVSTEEREVLKALSTGPRTTLEARDVIEAFLAKPTQHDDAPLRAVTGLDPSSFADDQLVLGPDGSDHGSSGVAPYTRSYDAVHEGPMRLAHGSKAPRSSVLTEVERAGLSTRTPAEALDAAAKELGVKLGPGFVGIANSKSFFDPEAPTWFGKCHAWAWSALSNELSARVDVGGPEGRRGLWLSGQWISRADLGNFLMGVSDTIALSDGHELMQSPVTPMDLLEGAAQFMLDGGGGVVADIHNDAAHGGEREVWNQPFVAADVDTKTLVGEGAAAVLALAEQEGVRGVAVKHVHLVGRYGNEQSDAWEGPWNQGSRSWNVYAVTDARGAVLAAYMADDPKLEGVHGLPTRASHELPEYWWKPSLQAAEAGLAGTPDEAIDDNPFAREYRFFTGTVLTRGVPGATRAAFEAEVAKAPAGALSPDRVTALREKYPGIAAAYSREQWARAFASRGL